MPSWGFNADAQGWTGDWIDTDGVGGLGCLTYGIVSNPEFRSDLISVPVALNDPFSAWVKLVSTEYTIQGGVVEVSIVAAGSPGASSTPVILTIPAADPQTYDSGWFKISAVFPGADTILEVQVIFSNDDETITFYPFVDAVYLAETDPLGSLNYTLTRSAGGVPGAVMV